MRRFIYSSIALLALFITTLIALMILAYHDHYDTPKGRNMLFLGDSHIECSIDDVALSRGVNLGNGGESYFGALINLRAVLAGENDIDTVVLGCWTASLMYRSDRLSDLTKHGLDSRMGYIT